MHFAATFHSPEVTYLEEFIVYKLAVDQAEQAQLARLF